MREPVPVGEVPGQAEITTSDEQYGQQVLSMLTDQYSLSRDDQLILRVRDIVDTLTQAAKVDQNPWQVTVFDDPGFANAAATRGNFIFVWTGLLNALQNDDELATVLAHEIGHVLAGHTAPDPVEEVNAILAGVAGAAASIAVSSTQYGMLADLAELVVRSTLAALITNPEAQRKELEADIVGLFLMSDARYDPQKAVAFWQRVQGDPRFSGFSVEFLSSHPSSERRLQELQAQLPLAIERYQQALGQGGPAPKQAPTTKGAPRSQPKSTPPVAPTATPLGKPAASDWGRVRGIVPVYAEPSASSEVLDELMHDTRVRVLRKFSGSSGQGSSGQWLQISEPVSGYIRAIDARPER
jgi:predicted Zn-dependent protease